MAFNSPTVAKLMAAQVTTESVDLQNTAEEGQDFEGHEDPFDIYLKDAKKDDERAVKRQKREAAKRKAEEEAEEEEEGEAEEEEEGEEAEEETKQPVKPAEEKAKKPLPAKLQPTPIPVPELPQQQVFTKDQVFGYEYRQAALAVLQKSGYQVTDNNFDEAMRQLNAHDHQTVVDWARNVANAKASQYEQTVLMPHRQAVFTHRLATFLNGFQEDFPDVQQYVPAMNKIAEELIKKHPAMQENPIAAIPYCYAKAKEQALKEVARNAKHPQVRSQGLEKGTARRSKGLGPNRNKSEETIFGSSAETMLDKLFGS